MLTFVRRAARRGSFVALFAVVLSLWATAQTLAADPIKVGFSMALTGAVAPNGKQNLLALELWRDDVNASGGIMGRPVELVYYDDQSNPNNVPGIYTKLISVDKVDLLLGPYATNMIAPAMPVIMQNNKMTISMLGVNVNRQFNYARYFSMVPGGDEGTLAFSRGWFELAAAQTPKPKTVALIAADAEFGKTACDGARESAKKNGFDIVYDKSYPPGNADMVPIVRAIQATNADTGVCVRVSARHRRHRAGRERDRAHAQDVRRRHDWVARNAHQDAARPAGERFDHHGELHSGAEARLPGPQGDAGEIPGEGARAEDRPAGLRLHAIRLCGRSGAGAGGRRQPRASIT